MKRTSAKKVLVPRKTSGFQTTFKTRLNGPMESLRKYLAQYLEYCPEDTYWDSIHRKIVMGKVLTEEELRRAEELKNSYDLDEAYMNQLLGLEPVQNQQQKSLLQYLEKLTAKVEEAYQHDSSLISLWRLSDWDKGFLLGKDGGQGALAQLKSRGALSPKQIAQVKRLGEKCDVSGWPDK